MEDLRERLEKAVSTLEQLRDGIRNKTYQDQYSWDDLNRLNAKISGVKLAISYLEEMLDG